MAFKDIWQFSFSKRNPCCQYVSWLYELYWTMFLNHFKTKLWKSLHLKSNPFPVWWPRVPRFLQPAAWLKLTDDFRKIPGFSRYVDLDLGTKLGLILNLRIWRHWQKKTCTTHQKKQLRQTLDLLGQHAMRRLWAKPSFWCKNSDDSPFL